MSIRKLRTDGLRCAALVLVAFIPYLDALTDPVKTSEQVTDVAVAIIAAIIVCLYVVEHITKPVSVGLQSLRRLSPIVPFALLAAVFWVSYSANPTEHGLGKCLRFTFLVLPFSACFITLFRRPEDIRWPLLFLFGFGLFISSVAIVFSTHTPFVFLSHGHDASVMHRGYGRYLVFGTLSACTAIFGVIAFCESSTRLNIFKRSLFLIAAAVGVVGSIKSGERASLITVAFAMFLYAGHVIYSLRKPGSTVIAGRLGIVLCLTVAAGLVVAFSPQADFFWMRWEVGGFANRFNYTDGAYVAPFIPNLKSSPILGVGPQNYFRDFKQPITNHPHNMFWEIGGETGLTGLLVYLLILFTFARGLHVAYKLHERDPQDGIFLAACAIGIVLLLRTFKMGNVVRSDQFWMYWIYFSWLSELRLPALHYSAPVDANQITLGPSRVITRPELDYPLSRS